MLKIKLTRNILFYEDPTKDVPFDSHRIKYVKGEEFEFNEVYAERLKPYGIISETKEIKPKTTRKKAQPKKQG